MPDKDIGFKIALKCMDADGDESNSQDDQNLSQVNFRVEDLFATRADGCTMYETVPGIKSIFETPHPYIFDMECRENFKCKNAEYIHYRLHKMDINCQFRRRPDKPKPQYFDADYLKIDIKG